VLRADEVVIKPGRFNPREFQRLPGARSKCAQRGNRFKGPRENSL
jgi:hypothetical protein